MSVRASFGLWRSRRNHYLRCCRHDRTSSRSSDPYAKVSMAACRIRYRRRGRPSEGSLAPRFARLRNYRISDSRRCQGRATTRLRTFKLQCNNTIEEGSTPDGRIFSSIQTCLGRFVRRLRLRGLEPPLTISVCDSILLSIWSRLSCAASISCCDFCNEMHPKCGL